MMYINANKRGEPTDQKNSETGKYSAENNRAVRIPLFLFANVLDRFSFDGCCTRQIIAVPEPHHIGKTGLNFAAMESAWLC